jgi:hypothetical protein
MPKGYPFKRDVRSLKSRVNLTCYRVTAYVEGRRFQETTYARSAKEAISNVKYKIWKKPYVYYPGIRVTEVAVYNETTLGFDIISMVP